MSSVKSKSSRGITVMFQYPVTFRCVTRHSSLEQLQPTDAFLTSESNQTRFRHGSCSLAAALPSSPHRWNTARSAAASEALVGGCCCEGGKGTSPCPAARASITRKRATRAGGGGEAMGAGRGGRAWGLTWGSGGGGIGLLLPATSW
uniref:Uncharacterized protein n=1 Tax=Arundo donax TaxID=35708 RepID=A0A0A9F519_ARUDO